MSNLEYKEKFSDNVWFTRKARIQSEKRLLKNHNHSQLLLIYFTLIGAIASIITLKYEYFLGDNTSLILAIFSVIILVLSLIVTNFNFKERSNSFKNNYIELQKLYEELVPLEKANSDSSSLKNKYYKILELCDNHEKIDDICSRVENSKNLYSRKPSLWEYIIYFSYKIGKFFFIISCYVLIPLLFVLYKFCII